MKIFFYLIILIAAIIAALYFFKPELFLSIKSTITEKVTTVIPTESLSKKTTIYKWNDKNGELQISNTPPPKGFKYITEEIRYDANIIPSETLTGKRPQN